MRDHGMSPNHEVTIAHRLNRGYDGPVVLREAEVGSNQERAPILKVLKHLKTGNSGPAGDIQTLLERLLIEVTAQNYRYFLQEYLIFGDETDCEPPLIAKERELSGLFYQALSNVCPVSRPEFGIKRSRADGKKLWHSAGRVDYFAIHGERSVGLELKRVAIGMGTELKRLDREWKKVSSQAETALGALKGEGLNHPVGIGLLVIRMFRNIGSSPHPGKIAEVNRRFVEVLGEVDRQIKPSFLAAYRFPDEMQISGGWGRNKTSYMAFPGLIFAAAVRLKAQAS
jgi:hypothetical protein